jgi:hypothetical protein
MIPFAMVVLDILRQRAPEMVLSQGNQAIQALFFDGPHKPFGLRVCIGARTGVITTRMPASRN